MASQLPLGAQVGWVVKHVHMRRVSCVLAKSPVTVVTNEFHAVQRDPLAVCNASDVSCLCSLSSGANGRSGVAEQISVVTGDLRLS